MDDDSRGSPPLHTLSYAQPGTTHPSSFKYVAAIIFAVGAVALGILVAWGGIDMLKQAERLMNNTTDQRRFRSEGIQMLVASVILIAPGIWYGRVGIRAFRRSGERRAASPPMQRAGGSGIL